MKKLLSLLSVLTIGGTAVPTTIAASPYKKEKQLNSYLQTNNLKQLDRIKRQQNKKTSKKILVLTEKLIIDSNNSREYTNSSRRVLQNLEIQRILIPVINVGEENQDSIIYTLNNENYGYFRVPVEIIGVDDQNQQSYRRNLELILRTDNLYLQGFIINNNYYHFNFNNVNMARQPQSVRDGSVPLLTQIEGMQSHQLSRIGPDYRDLLPQSNNNINWNNIFSSFLYLTNNIDINENTVEHLEQQGLPIEGLATSLGRVIFSTAEAIRFRNIYNIINNDIINSNNNVSLNFRDNEIYQILVSWGSTSRRYNSVLFNEQNRYRGFEENQYGIDLFIYNIIGHNNEYSFINDLTPIDVITEYLRNFNTRVLLGAVLPTTFSRITPNCNKFYGRSNGTTEFENPFWKKQFCDYKPQIEKINGEIKVVKIIDNDTKGENFKFGDIFVGTDNGVYLIHAENRVDKFENLNINVKDIFLDGNNGAYTIDSSDEIYYLNSYDLSYEKLKVDNISSKKMEIIVKELKKENKNDIVTIIKNINKNITNPNGVNLKSDDLYIVTNNRVYFMSNNILIDKFLISSIKDINLYDNGDVYGINNKNEIYDLTINLNDWSVKLKSNWSPISGESLESWYKMNLNHEFKMRLSYRAWLYVWEIYNISSNKNDFVNNLYNKVGYFLPNTGNMSTSDNLYITNYIGGFIYDNWYDITNKINKMAYNNYMTIATRQRGGGSVHDEL